MDNIDKRIIAILKKNARTPFMQIAQQVDVSEGTVRNRVKELTAQGIIKQFTIATTKDVAAVVGVITQTGTKTNSITAAITKYVTAAYEVSGKYDIIALIPGSTAEEINTTVERIRTIAGVSDTETFTVLAQR